MKKAMNVIFAAALVGGIGFAGEAISSATDTGNSFEAQAQTARVRSNRRVGLTRRVYRGGKYIGTKVWDGTKWVGVNTWKGTKYVGRKTWRGTKKVGRVTKRILY